MSEYKKDNEEFFNDISFDDYIPTLKVAVYTTTVEAGNIELNADWTRAAADDIAREIDRDIVQRLIELGNLEIAEE